MTETLNPTKLPGLPSVPTSVDAPLRQYLTALGEIVEIRTGRKGDPRDRAVTLRELTDAGIVTSAKARAFDPNTIDLGNIGITPANLAVPPQPTNVTATGAYAQIILSWNSPYDVYSNHGFTEIWRHDSDAIGDATRIGVSTGFSYIDAVGGDQTYYYWVRFVSSENITGPWNASAGVTGVTQPDVDELLDVLSGEIERSDLATTLVNDLDDLEGQYSVKINANGRIAGFGLSNTAPAYDGGIHSEFIVLADRFSIVNQTDDGDLITPFTVTTSSTTLNGESVPAGVYIDQAFIRNGAIANAKIGDLAVDTAKIASLAVTTAKIDSLAVTTAKIASLAVTAAKIANATITNAQIANATITGAKIGNLEVDTINITGNAVSQSGISAASSATSDSVTFTSGGGSVLVLVTFYPPNTNNRTYSIKRGATTLRSLTISQTSSIIMFDIDEPSAGSVTYSAEASSDTMNAIYIQYLEVLK